MKSLRVSRVLLYAALLGCLAGGLIGIFVTPSPRPEPELESHAADDVAVRHIAPNKPPRPPRADPRALEGLPYYPGAHAAPLINEPDGVRGEMKAAWFTTPDSTEDVIQFYERKLNEAKLPVVSHRFSANAGYAGYLDKDLKTLHLITVVRQGKETVVFASSNDPMKMIERMSGEASGLPEPPNSRRGVAIDATEAGGTRTFSLTASATSVESVVEFYKRSLPAAGWRIETDTSSEGAVRVDANRSNQAVQLWIRRKVSGDVSVSITILRQA